MQPHRGGKTPIISETKTCNKCHETKPINDFYKKVRKQGDGKSIGNYFAVCKECENDGRRTEEFRQKHRPWYRENMRKVTWDAMLKISPDGEPKCAICGFKANRNLLQFDHKNDDGVMDKINGVRRAGKWIAYKILNMSVEDAMNKYQILCVAHNWIKRYGITGEDYALVVVKKPEAYIP